MWAVVAASVIVAETVNQALNESADWYYEVNTKQYKRYSNEASKLHTEQSTCPNCGAPKLAQLCAYCRTTG